VDRHGTTPAGAEALRYVRAIRRRAQYILLPIVLVPCAAVVGLSFVAPVFESSSVVIYEEKLPFAHDMGDMIVQRSGVDYRDNARLAQLEARLKSGFFLSEAVQKLNIGPKGTALEKLESARTPGVSREEFMSRVMVGALRKSIKIEETGPDLFKITVAHPDREMAYRLTDAITKCFVEYVTKGQVADIRAAGTLSEDQLPVYEAKLSRDEEKLKQFRAQMATRAAREGTSVATSVESARSVLNQAEMEIAELDEHRKTSKETMDSNYPNAVDPVTLIRGAGISSAYSEVLKEEQVGVPMLVQGVSTSSVMERVGQAREKLLAAIGEAVGNTLRGSPEALQSLVSEQVYDNYVMRSLEKRRSLVSALMGQYSREAGRQPQDEVELTKLEQEVEADRTVLQSLRRQLTSSRISEAAQSTNLGVRIEIIEPATRPFAPAGPRKQRIVVLAFLLGPFLGISFAILSEYMDDSVKSVDDVTRSLGMPVLGTIPKVPGANQWRATKTRRWPYFVVLVTVILTIGVRLGHEPLLRLIGRQSQGIEIADFTQTTGKVLTGNEKTGDNKGATDHE
jgi:polysaccharide biosynthesis transport protein